MQNTKIDCFHIGVKALIVNKDGKVLLLERDHPSKKIYWDIPGGRLQKGESLIATLLREVYEETGWSDIQTISPFAMVLSNIRIPTDGDSVGLIFSIFRCYIDSTFDPILSSEHINFDWVAPFEASQKLKADYPQDFIENLSQMR